MCNAHKHDKRHAYSTIVLVQAAILALAILMQYWRISWMPSDKAIQTALHQKKFACGNHCSSTRES